MKLLAIMLMIVVWPIAVMASNILLSIVLMPMVGRFLGPGADRRPSYWLPNVLQALTVSAGQVVAFLLGKYLLLWIAGESGAQRIAITYAIWSLVALVVLGGRSDGRMYRNIGWSWRIGLVIGWIAGAGLVL